MPIDSQLIKEKLTIISGYITRIENMELSETMLTKDIDCQDLLTFRLQQAVETAIDIATHLIATLHLEKPDTARSSFEVLAKHKVIRHELAIKLTFAVSFRNLAVHGYDKFDFKRLFYDYKDDLADLKEYITEVLHFLEKQ